MTFDAGVLLRDGHSYAPMLLSVLKETVAKHGEEMKASCTTFREESNMCQFLYTYEQWLGGKCIDGSHAHKYFSIDSGYVEMAELLLGGKVGVACFNDAGVGDWREMKNVVYKVMQKILGEKCGYEI